MYMLSLKKRKSNLAASFASITCTAWLLICLCLITTLPVNAQQQQQEAGQGITKKGTLRQKNMPDSIPKEATKQDAIKQENPDKPSLWDKIYIGGNFGLQLGTYTYIDISPLVGYKFTNRFSAGPGIAYRYLSIRNVGSNSIYGGKVFARYLISKQFFVHTEYESLNTQLYERFAGRDRIVREWVPGFFVGGGIAQPVGNRAAVMIYGLYNLLYDNVRSPYPSPWIISVGFTI